MSQKCTLRSQKCTTQPLKKTASIVLMKEIHFFFNKDPVLERK